MGTVPFPSFIRCVGCIFAFLPPVKVAPCEIVTSCGLHWFGRSPLSGLHFSPNVKVYFRNFFPRWLNILFKFTRAHTSASFLLLFLLYFSIIFIFPFFITPFLFSHLFPGLFSGGNITRHLPLNILLQFFFIVWCFFLASWTKASKGDKLFHFFCDVENFQSNFHWATYNQVGSEHPGHPWTPHHGFIPAGDHSSYCPPNLQWSHCSKCSSFWFGEQRNSTINVRR